MGKTSRSDERRLQDIPLTWRVSKNRHPEMMEFLSVESIVRSFLTVTDGNWVKWLEKLVTKKIALASAAR